MGEEIRGKQSQPTNVPSSHMISLQELQAKYQDSKRELDELVASMEGL